MDWGGMNGTLGPRRDPVPDPSCLQQYSEWLECRHEADLLPMKEDLAAWLNAILGLEVTAVGLMDVLQTGVVLCQLAEELQERMILASNGKSFVRRVIRWRADAAPGSFFARDNAANFLYWCRKIGVRESHLFESEDLAMSPPQSPSLEPSPSLGPPPAPPPDPGALPSPPSPAQVTQPKLEPPSPISPSPIRPPVSTPNSSRRLSKPIGKKSSENLLDDIVKQISEDPPCRCVVRFRIEKQPKGHYCVGDKVLYVRMLNDKNVMVRVGGGWEAFGTYLLKHDPCRTSPKPRRSDGRSANPRELSRDGYLVVGTPSRLKKQMS